MALLNIEIFQIIKMTPFFFHTYIILLHTNKKIIKNVHVNNLEEKIIDSVNNHTKQNLCQITYSLLL